MSQRMGQLLGQTSTPVMNGSFTNSMTIMSSQDSSESLNHSVLVSQKITNLFMNERYCDGVVVAEHQRLPVIKAIIAQHSKYFDDFFYGNDKKNEVLLPNHIKADPLKTIIKYCHSGEINYNEYNIQTICQIFGVAFDLGFVDLVSGVSEYLETKLNKESVLEMYSFLHKFKGNPLVVNCLNYINFHATSILIQKAFFSLSAEILADILSSDSFAAPELDIFKAVIKWIEQNPGEDIKSVTSKLRLYLISFKDLLNVVRKSGKISEGSLMEVMKMKAKKNESDMKYRAYFRYDKNVLSPKFKPQLLSGENNNGNLFSMDQYFGPDRGFVYHSIGQENKQILVKLGMPSKVNHIKLLLLDFKPIAYSYTVEVSLDQNEWYKVADYSMYWCRGWQNISFHPHVIQYIRVIGIRSYFDDSNPIFCLVNIQCSFSSQRISFKNHDGIPLIIPGHNVATYANGAILWVSQPNATLFDRTYELLSGSDKLTTNCIQLDQSKYLYPACHKISGNPEDNILIHLSQPFMIDRLKLMIFSPDGQSTYSFTIHVSSNGLDYTLVLDKREELCTDWQECRFQSTPISFIRITGTKAHNSNDQIFRLAHFECSGSPSK